MAVGGKLIGRFVGATPVALVRIAGGTNVRLRAEATQKAAGRTSFDISAPDGIVAPRDPAEERFLGPNGMPMRSKGPTLAIIVGTFKAPKTVLHEVPQGTPIPPELVVLHEHSDHYSVQPAERMTLTKLNAALTAFLAQPGVARFDSKEAWYQRHPDMRPEVVGFSNNA